MRLSRILVVMSILVLCTPLCAQQTQQAIATPASDPQAVAVVQAAITALGGATAIGQAQNWDFQGVSNGPIEGENKAETINAQPSKASIMVKGIARPAHRFVTASPFLPALVGAILLQESQDVNYELHFDGTSTLGTRSVNVVKFLETNSHTIAQIWAFDAITGLPARVYFVSPAQIGLTKTYRGLVDLSDFRPVSGVLHPFTIVSYKEGQQPETISLQALAPSAAFSGNQTGSTTGGVQ